MDEFNLLKIKNRLKPLNRRLKDSFDRKALNDALIKLEERAIGEHLFDEIRSDINSKSRKNTDKWNDPEEVKKTVTVAKIMYTSRRISIDKYVFFAVFPVEAYHEKRMDIELDPINQKIDEIQKKHGLEEDEYWQIGEGPKEYINLIKKWEDIYDSLFLKTLKEFDLDDLADMILNDTNRFEQLRERGRRAVFHSNETIPIIKDIVVRFEEDARRAASVKAYSAAVLSLGAGAVIMGTRLMMTKECPIHDNLKQALCNASELDTMLIMRSIGATHRVWNNAAAQKCLEIEKSNGDFDDVLSIVVGDKARKMYDEGDIEIGVVSAGQGLGLIHDIPTMKELFDRVVSEAGETISRLAK